jgi:REP element-mobilizing transposase RayT
MNTNKQHVSDQRQDAFATFFNPTAELDITEGNLPHWHQDHVWYFVTFRLADSLPADAVRRIQAEREAWLKQRGNTDLSALTPEPRAEYHRLFSRRIDTLLDAGQGGCLLREDRAAQIVADALKHFEGERYLLDEWVVMPNHVHVLVCPINGHHLPDILHAWKSFTSNQVNKAYGRTGRLWQNESYDHIVRNECAFHAIRRYIAENPVRHNNVNVAKASSL